MKLAATPYAFDLRRGHGGAKKREKVLQVAGAGDRVKAVVATVAENANGIGQHGNFQRLMRAQNGHLQAIDHRAANASFHVLEDRGGKAQVKVLLNAPACADRCWPRSDVVFAC